jgi:DNA replication and repair protein RecF
MTESISIREPGENVLGLERLRLKNFRNYLEVEVSLDERLNLIVGRNGQGKTNLLEAIYLLSTTQLLRGQRDHEAILDTANAFHVEGDLLGGSTSVAMSLERGARRRAFLNGLKLPRAADLLGRLPSGCISALDLEIVRGEPSERRHFLDIELSSLSPRYLGHLAKFKRALEQRNSLLRQAREMTVSDAMFEPWEEQLSEHGEEIRERRRAYVDELGPLTANFQNRLGEGEALSLEYDLHDDDPLVMAYPATRGQDIGRGSTTRGPHRDDLIVLVDGRAARLFGSQGQQRSAVISLKLAALHVAKRQMGATPMLLLDDILSDLDERRRAVLIEIVLEHQGQAILTCTEAESAGADILSKAVIFQVNGGTVMKQ